jgi:hypothetical protein
MANTAMLDVVAHTGYSLRKLIDIGFGLAQQVEYQSQSRLPPHPRQFGKLADGLLQQL